MRAALLLAALGLAAGGTAPAAHADNFSTGQTAEKFGVHEVSLTGDGNVANPFDVPVTVTFTPPSGAGRARTVPAFYDGENTWRARTYVSEPGPWQWQSRCATDPQLAGRSGSFMAADSQLPGRLLPHPQNPRQWITENGRWFLNLSDTAYFLLCAHDGNGEAISDDAAQRYVRDDVARGITSLRCFLASHPAGFSESSEQWKAWHFADDSFDRLRLANLQCADRRLQMLLNEHPDVAVQLILFPLEGYARDDRFWKALTPAQRERLLRNLVARFAAHPQLFWLIVNDAHYGEKYPSNNALAREVGVYLKLHDLWQHPRSAGHARRLPFFFGREDWATYVHIEHAHDLGALQYRPYHDLAKPVFLGEDRYEQDHGPRQDPLHMNDWQRRLFWAWLLSGGSTNYGGRWWAVHPYSETGARSGTYQKRTPEPFRTQLTGLDSVRPIRDYFETRAIDLGQFEPDHARAEAPGVQSEARSPRVMRRAQEEFLIYHPHAAADDQAAQIKAGVAAQLRVNLGDANGNFAVEWFRAADGHAQPGPDLPTGAWHNLTAPWPSADVVLRLQKK